MEQTRRPRRTADTPTWLCWLSWLLKVTVRLVAALGVLLLANIFFPFSKALHLRLHISMFWKQDFTLKCKVKKKRWDNTEGNLETGCRAKPAQPWLKSKNIELDQSARLSISAAWRCWLTVSCEGSAAGESWWRRGGSESSWAWSACPHPASTSSSAGLWTPACRPSLPGCLCPPGLSCLPAGGQEVSVCRAAAGERSVFKCSRAEF